MIAGIDIQTVWSESKGEVQLFIGDFRIGLPPALCEQLEKDLAAARRVPERARLMANTYDSRSDERADLAAWGGDPVASE